VKVVDALLQINVETSKNQKATAEQQLSIDNNEINGIEKLINSIQSGHNQFEFQSNILRGNSATLKSRIFELTQTISNSTVKATVNCKVSLLAALRNNDLVAAGSNALTIIPQNCKQQVICVINAFVVSSEAISFCAASCAGMRPPAL